MTYQYVSPTDFARNSPGRFEISANLTTGGVQFVGLDNGGCWVRIREDDDIHGYYIKPEMIDEFLTAACNFLIKQSNLATKFGDGPAEGSLFED